MAITSKEKTELSFPEHTAGERGINRELSQSLKKGKKKKNQTDTSFSVHHDSKWKQRACTEKLKDEIALPLSPTRSEISMLHPQQR